MPVNMRNRRCRLSLLISQRASRRVAEKYEKKSRWIWMKSEFTGDVHWGSERSRRSTDCQPKMQRCTRLCFDRWLKKLIKPERFLDHRVCLWLQPAANQSGRVQVEVLAFRFAFPVKKLENLEIRIGVRQGSSQETIKTGQVNNIRLPADDFQWKSKRKGGCSIKTNLVEIACCPTFVSLSVACEELEIEPNKRT